MKDTPQYKSPDKFDRLMGALTDLPDVTKSKPATKIVTLPIIGSVTTVVVQTLRQKEVGDYIFIQYVDDAGSVRLFLPPAVADAIARQREALGTKNRKRAAKERAAIDKANGVVPGFMRNGGKRTTKKKVKESS